MDTCVFEEGGAFNVFYLEKLTKPGVEDYLAKMPTPRAKRYVLPLTVPEDKVGCALWT